MVQQLNGKLREAIDAFAEGTIRTPLHVGTGNMYFFPSKTDLGEFYIVVQLQYTYNGQVMRGWACSCKAYRFAKDRGEETCKHIEELEEGLVGRGGVKGKWTPGKPTKSPTPSTSKQRVAKPQGARSTRRTSVSNKASTGRSSTQTKKVGKSRSSATSNSSTSSGKKTSE